LAVLLKEKNVQLLGKFNQLQKKLKYCNLKHPHQFELLDPDPDPHKFELLDPDPDPGVRYALNLKKKYSFHLRNAA
jgi:hypothetical protein